MAGEKQVIYYSTIHLTRREDILVQSIISLYRSKDGFEWIHGELKDAMVVIIGTGANSLLKSDQDPFEGIEKEQVICILGDTFYPKNARAVVHIDLPIKALVFVDQLSDIERSYINKPFSMSYVASNFLAKQTLQAQVDNTIANVSSMQSTQAAVLNKNGMIDFVPRNIKVSVEDSIAVNEVDEDTENISVSSGQIKKSIQSNFLKNETVKKDAFSFNLEAGLYKEKDLSKEADKSISPIAFVVKEQVPTGSDVLTKSIDDTADIIVKEPPVLTEAIIDDKMWESLLKGKTTNSELTDKPDASLSLTTEKNIQDSEIKPIAIESKVGSEVSVNVTIAQENISTKPESPKTSETDQLKRIKLLRWPKSEIIQRHPGNAILASMVINMPMSVSDMAKQSDLPILICQRFMDAVIESNVAEYVDDIPNNTDASKLENNDVSNPENKVEEVKKVEEVSKRKGILYRIRAALGLLRK